MKAIKFNKEGIEKAAKAIKEGKIVALPTDTLYAIAADINNKKAVEKIYKIKKMKRNKKISILFDSVESAEKYVKFDDVTELLAKAFMPGQITLIAKPAKKINSSFVSKAGVAFRVPDNKKLRMLIKKTGPLTGTSANISGFLPASSYMELEPKLKINLVLKGKTLGVASTIVDSKKRKILREGAIKKEEILKLIKNYLKKRIIAKGAEAEIKFAAFMGEPALRKIRTKKAYRVEELDRKIRGERTKKEAKILFKVMNTEIRCPLLLDVNIKDSEIVFEYLHGKLLRDVEEKEQKRYLKETGKMLGELHKAGIVHGDFTTSNLLVSKRKLHLIDFGLSMFSESKEERATDLLLLKKTLGKKLFKKVVESYCKNFKKHREVLSQLEAIEKRGRYKFNGT